MSYASPQLMKICCYFLKIYDQNICLEYKKSAKEIFELEMTLGPTATIFVSSGFPESRGVERALPQSSHPYFPIHQLPLKQSVKEIQRQPGLE